MNYSKTSLLAILGLQAALLATPGTVRAQEPAKKPAPKLHHAEPKAKLQERAAPAPAAEKPQAQAAAAPQAETTSFQGWQVNCAPAAQAGQPRTCIAKMGILKSKEDPRPVVIMNILKAGGKQTLYVQTPTTVDLTPGVTLQLGEGKPLHLNYVSCEPALCSAALPIDDAIAKDIASSSKAVVTWVGLGVGEVRVEYGMQEAGKTLAFLGTR